MSTKTILFFDTETTGLPNYKLPPDHPSQPHIVQLAAQLCTEDGDVISGFSFVIDQGVDIPKTASDVHGITTDYATEFGVRPGLALEAWECLYSHADLLCAHNIKFDRAVLETALSWVDPWPKEALSKPQFCTMEASTPILNLPPTERMLAAGYDKPKAPKLEECVKHFFGEELDGAHDAMVDLEACRRVYFHLRGLGVVTGGGK